MNENRTCLNHEQLEHISRLLETAEIDITLAVKRFQLEEITFPKLRDKVAGIKQRTADIVGHYIVTELL